MKFLLCSLVLIASPVLAQEDTLKTVNIVVDGVRSAKVSPITKKTVTLASELGHVNLSQDMPLLLTATPSITAYSESGAYNGYAYFRLRGLDQSRINLTLNGVPLNEPEDQGVYFANFADFSHVVKKMQIQRGVGSTSYGNTSYAGAIDFETVVPHNTGRAIDYNYTRLLGSEYTAKSGPFATFVRSTSQRVPGFRDHSDNRSWSAFVVSDYLWPKSMVRVVAFTGWAQNELAWAPSPLSEIKKNPAHNPLSTLENDRFAQSFVSGLYTSKLSDALTSNVTLYYNALRGHYDVNIDGIERFNLGSQWYGASQTFEFVKDGVTVNTGLHGYRYTRDHFLTRPNNSTRVYDNSGNRDELSGFLKASYTMDKWNVLSDIQLRTTTFAYASDKRAPVKFDKAVWNFVNPKFGVSYVPNANTKYYGFVGQTTREPTRNDIFAGFDNIDSTNAAFIGSLTNVKPETVLDYEAGVEHSKGRYGVTANVFHMQFNNEIAPIGKLSYIGLPLRKNIPNSYRQGVEFDARYLFNLWLVGTSNVTLMRSNIAEYTDDDTRQTYKNTPSLLTPSVLVNADLTHRFRGLSTTVRGRHIGKSYLDNTGDVRWMLPAATLFDLRETVSVGQISVTAQVSNIFNTLTYASGQRGMTEPLYFVNTLRNITIFGRLTY